ncbi:MAG: DMT family transporter, partial [Candidatus Competibacterales bacterium]
LAAAGVGVIVSDGTLATFRNLSFAVGDGLVLLGVLCYAAYSTLLRLRPAVHPWSFLAATFALGVLMLTPLYLWQGSVTGQWVPTTVPAIAGVVYTGLFASVLAYWCFNHGVAVVGPNRAGLFINLIPVFGTAMAIVFLGEPFGLHHALGALGIVVGIALALRAQVAAAKPKILRS